MIEKIKKWLAGFRSPNSDGSGKFLSEDEIVIDLANKAAEGDWRSWLLMKESDLIRGHFSTGMAIRNEYRLWESPHCYPDDGKHPNHPDNMSMRIIKRVWARLWELARCHDWPNIPTQEEIERHSQEYRQMLRGLYGLSERAPGESNLSYAVRTARGHD
jgi:hypothetical protein